MIINETNQNDFVQRSLKAKTARVLIFITQDEKDDLKSLSCSSGLSMTEIIRRSIYNTIHQ